MACLFKNLWKRKYANYSSIKITQYSFSPYATLFSLKYVGWVHLGLGFFLFKKGLSKNYPFFICVNSIHNDYNVSISYFKPSSPFISSLKFFLSARKNASFVVKSWRNFVVVRRDLLFKIFCKSAEIFLCRIGESWNNIFFV